MDITGAMYPCAPAKILQWEEPGFESFSNGRVWMSLLVMPVWKMGGELYDASKINLNQCLWLGSLSSSNLTQKFLQTLEWQLDFLPPYTRMWESSIQ